MAWLPGNEETVGPALCFLGKFRSGPWVGSGEPATTLPEQAQTCTASFHGEAAHHDEHEAAPTLQSP